MVDTIGCENCGHLWPAAALEEIHDYWERVEPGGVVPLGECPNIECGALCYPSYGYVYDLEQRLSTMQDVLARLLAWAESMGGWEAPVWEEARRVVTAAVAGEPNAHEGAC